MRSSVAPPETDVARAIAAIPDPEIPVLSIEELGILRSVHVDGGSRTVEVTITPTYSGCPALDAIRSDIEACAARRGFTANVGTVLSPAWTTDWLSDSARDKLRMHGVAPPRRRDPALRLLDLRVACPVCGSTHTDEVAHFAATPCQALRRCGSCSEPFQHFKEH